MVDTQRLTMLFRKIIQSEASVLQNNTNNKANTGYKSLLTTEFKIHFAFLCSNIPHKGAIRSSFLFSTLSIAPWSWKSQQGCHPWPCPAKAQNKPSQATCSRAPPFPIGPRVKEDGDCFACDGAVSTSPMLASNLADGTISTQRSVKVRNIG